MKKDLSIVTKEEFLAYHRVKEAGVIPLYEFQNIKQATGLNPIVLMTIMDNYNELSRKFIEGDE